MSLVIDPYASPTAPAEEIPQITPGRYYRDGEFLRMCSGAELPLICPISGESIGPDGWRKAQSMVWLSPRIAVAIISCLIASGILVRLLPQWMPLATIAPVGALAAAAFLFRRGSFTCSLAPSVSRKFAIRRTISIVLLLAGVDLLIGMIALNFSGTAMVAGTVSLLAFIASVIFAALAKPLRSTGYYRGWFRLKGCSPQFLDTLPQFPFSPESPAKSSRCRTSSDRQLPE